MPDPDIEENILFQMVDVPKHVKDSRGIYNLRISAGCYHGQAV